MILEAHQVSLAVNQAMLDAVDRFVWHPEKWLRQTALSGVELQVNMIGAPALRRHLSRRSRTCDLPLSEWRSGQTAGALQLALLSRDEWLRLGMVTSMLPMCGHARDSIDGNFRRVVKQCLDQDGLEKLDHGFPAGTLRSRLGPGAWRDPSAVALGGVSAVLGQLCKWPQAVMNRFTLGFEPGELQRPQAVVGLNSEWMEFACKISWPDHPWLSS